MSDPPSLPAALFRHAGSRPEEPWLFRAEGWDWRWHAWGEIAARVRERAESFAGRPAGARVPFAWEARPEGVVLDLAIQTAGLVAAPGAGPSPLAPLPPPPFPPPRERGTPALPLENGVSSPSSPGEVGREGAGEEGRGGEGSREGGRELSGEGRGGEGSGGAVILHNGGPVELSAAGLVALAETVQALVGPSPKREIVVLSGPLEIPEERAMLAWATVAGAAVVLEPSPALRAATAAWARPTVFHGTAAELAALRARAENEKQGVFRRRPRLPFRRLRTILVTGSGLPEEDEAFWRGRGVVVARL